MTAQTSSDSSETPAIGIVGTGPLSDCLLNRARDAGLQAAADTRAGSLNGSQTLWIVDPVGDLPDPQVMPAVIIATGFRPAQAVATDIAILRLSNPGQAGSLAELTPAKNGNANLAEMICRQARLMGYEPVPLAVAGESVANRVSHALMIEAMALLGDGVAPEAIEQAATDFGMTEPPLAMLDALSLSVMDEALHAELHALDHPHHDHDHDHDHGHEHDHQHGHHHHDHGHDDHGHHHAVQSQRFPEGAVYVLEKMAHGFDRMGADSGYGFYDHEEDGSRELWDGLSVFARGARKIADADITDRLIYVQAIEILRCLAQQKLTPEQANTASVAGWGFPAHSGGIHAWIESIGKQDFERRAAELAERYGPRFQPAG